MLKEGLFKLTKTRNIKRKMFKQDNKKDSINNKKDSSATSPEERKYISAVLELADRTARILDIAEKDLERMRDFHRSQKNKG